MNKWKFLLNETIWVQCTKYSKTFIYKDHGNIITGNLNIVNSAPLGKSIAKGPEYQEPKQINLAYAHQHFEHMPGKVKKDINKLNYSI